MFREVCKYYTEATDRRDDSVQGFPLFDIIILMHIRANRIMRWLEGNIQKNTGWELGEPEGMYWGGGGGHGFNHVTHFSCLGKKMFHCKMEVVPAFLPKVNIYYNSANLVSVDSTWICAPTQDHVYMLPIISRICATQFAVKHIDMLPIISRICATQFAMKHIYMLPIISRICATQFAVKHIRC
jgi:hypothetical protein